MKWKDLTTYVLLAKVGQMLREEKNRRDPTTAPRRRKRRSSNTEQKQEDTDQVPLLSLRDQPTQQPLGELVYSPITTEQVSSKTMQRPLLPSPGPGVARLPSPQTPEQVSSNRIQQYYASPDVDDWPGVARLPAPRTPPRTPSNTPRQPFFAETSPGPALRSIFDEKAAEMEMDNDSDDPRDTDYV